MLGVDMAVTPEIHVSRSGQEWAQEAAAFILSVSEQAIQCTGRCLVALSGGSTPKTLYRTLCQSEWKSRFNWPRIFFLFGDERCTPPEHAESNFGMAQAELFRPLNIHSDHIYRMKGEYQDPTVAAQEYERQLRELTKCPASEPPRLDVILLGLGEDGHTASLFPGTEALQEQSKIVTVGHAPTGIRHRLTLTLGVLNRAAVVLFLVTGPGKAEMVRRVIESESDADRSLPATKVSPESGRLVWMLDQTAAKQLTKRSYKEGT
ncbi:MAG: 6-phosphogluconolactonase [Nitrospira sp. BO4]|nr:6-phosphogluconolactonase [Nitrospira sp. BO4]